MSCKCAEENGRVVRPCLYHAPWFYAHNTYQGAHGSFVAENRRDSGTGRMDTGYRVTLNDGSSFFTWLVQLAIEVAENGVVQARDESFVHRD